jgi:hypothetical protein
MTLIQDQVQNLQPRLIAGFRQPQWPMRDSTPQAASGKARLHLLELSKGNIRYNVQLYPEIFIHNVAEIKTVTAMPMCDYASKSSTFQEKIQSGQQLMRDKQVNIA